MARRGQQGMPQQQQMPPPQAPNARQQMPPPPPTPSSRQNEYFLPRDGIDREVITADICRYLGNDALVRPGTYENPTTRQVSQGYYITAYRNLTSAMIDDLKADSARWEQERRMQSSRTPGVHYRSTDYRQSETHARRQNAGPTGTSGYDDRDPYTAPRYPGSDAPGYSGSSSASNYGQAAPGNQYGASGGSYPAGGYPGQGQYSAQDPRFPNQGMPMGGFGAQQDPYVDVGANMRPRDPRDPNQQAYRDQPQYPGGPTSRDHVMTSAPPPNPSYATAPQQQGYPQQSGGYGHPYGQQQPVGTHFGQPMQQPHDPFIGRSGGYPAASAANAKERTTSPVTKPMTDRYPPSQPAGHASQSYGPGQSQYDEQPAIRGSVQPNSSARRPEKDSGRHQSDRYHKSGHR